jgi:hypothetical protein
MEFEPMSKMKFAGQEMTESQIEMMVERHVASAIGVSTGKAKDKLDSLSEKAFGIICDKVEEFESDPTRPLSKLQSQIKICVVRDIQAKIDAERTKPKVDKGTGLPVEAEVTKPVVKDEPVKPAPEKVELTDDESTDDLI